MRPPRLEPAVVILMGCRLASGRRRTLRWDGGGEHLAGEEFFDLVTTCVQVQPTVIHSQQYPFQLSVLLYSRLTCRTVAINWDRPSGHTRTEWVRAGIGVHRAWGGSTEAEGGRTIDISSRTHPAGRRGRFPAGFPPVELHHFRRRRLHAGGQDIHVLKGRWTTNSAGWRCR